MDRPFVVAQATGQPGPSGTKIIPVNKPLGQEALTIHIDGPTTLDLTAIANEQITLVHLGDRLIILFNNYAQVTIEPFYGDNGQPLPDLHVDLGPGRDVTATDFAGLFPITTDATVLPAAGGPNGPSSGANFIGYSIDPLDVPNPLPLLGPSTFGGTFTDLTGGPLHDNLTTAATNIITLTGNAITGDTFEGGLVTDTIGTTGNHPGEPIFVSGGPGTLNSLVNFGPAGPGATPFQFVSTAAAEAWLSGLHLTSQGMAVDHVSIAGNTLIAGTDPAQTGQPTNDPNPHDVFSLTINPDGSVTFILLGPLDDANPGHLTPGPAVLDQITLDLSGLIQALDAQGNTLTLSHDVFVNVHDDAPVLITTIEPSSPEGPPDGPSDGPPVSLDEPVNNFVGGTVEETALTPGTPGDMFGSGNGGGTATVTGDLNTLVAFGADGPDFNLATHTYDGFQFVSQANATSWLNGLNLTSHGDAVDFAAIVGDTMTAWTGGGPGDPNAHEVFSFTLNGDGTFAFTLINPLDHPDPGHDTPSQPGIADKLVLDMSGFVQAVDFDGDAITLSGDFGITVVDDIPQQQFIDSEGSGSFFITVDEGGLTSGTPGDLFGTGNDPGAATSGGGSFSGTFAFGADGPDIVDGHIAAYQIAPGNNSLIDFGITSHGQEVDFVTVTNGPVGPDGTSQTLVAWTGGGPTDPNAHEVFSLTVNGDGTYTFTLINPIDHPAPGEDTFTLDLSSLVGGVDFDGDAVPMASGTFLVDIIDDVPNTVSNTASGTVDEGGLLSGTPGDLFGAGNDPGAATSATISLSGTVQFGADGPASQPFQFVDQTHANAWLVGLNLLSHGQAVDFADINGNVLTAWTGGGPTDPTAHEVFTLTLNGDQTFTFQLINPFDDPTGNGENSVSLDLSGLIHAVDFDGDAAPTASGSIVINIVDDVPVLTGDTTSGKVDEGGLEFRFPFFAPGDRFGDGNDPGAATSAHGSLADLVSFGADGPQSGTVSANSGHHTATVTETIADGFKFVSQAAAGAWLASLGLTSHGQALNFASIDTDTFTNGTSVTEIQTLTAWTNGGPFHLGHEVFTLSLNVTTGEWKFDLINPLDDPTGKGENSITVDLSGLVQAIDFDGDKLSLSTGTPSQNSDFIVKVKDDVPMLTDDHVKRTVDEGGLTVATDSFGSGNDPGAHTSASGGFPFESGSLNDLVSFGADGPALIGTFHTIADGFQFAVANNSAFDFGVKSHGKEVDFVTLSAPVVTFDGESQTLTAYAGEGGNAVFTLTLNGDGSWVFHLLEPLDDPSGHHENSVTLDLSNLIKAVDFDGDSVLLSHDFKIKVVDDVPVTVGNASSATVDEGGLGSGTPGDLFGTGNDQGAATSATVSLSGTVQFGADGPAATPFKFVDQAHADGWLVGLNLVSHGQAVDFAQIVGNVLTAWTGGGPTDPNAHEVFSLTLTGSQYTFQLINPLDHPNPGQATPGPAVEDTLNIDLSGLFQAVDFDGDKVTLTGSSTITVTDDVPVGAATPTNLLVNGSFELGHTDIGDGQWSIYTQIPGWTSGPDGVPFEVQVGNVGNLGAQDGNAKVELDSDLGGGNDPNNHNPTGHTNATIEQTVSTVANDIYELTFWYSPRENVVGTDSSSFNVLWDGHVVGSIDSTHIPVGWQEFTFGVTGTGSDTLAFQGTGTEDTFGAFIDNVGLVERAGIVDEGGLPAGNDPGAATSATGSLANLVSFGADGPAAGGGFAFVPHTDGDASSLVAGLGLSSHGSLVDHATLNGDTLAAFAHDGHEVFTLTLDGNGAWSFTLLSPLDDPQNGEDALTLDFSNFVQATDFDGDTVSLNPDTFAIAVIDDVPVAVSGTSSGAVDEGGLLSGMPGDLFGTGNDPAADTSATVSLAGLASFGADGPGAMPFEFVNQTQANAWLTGLNLVSHGQAVDFAQIVGNELIAWTGGGPTDPTAHEVFSVTLNSNETYTFQLINPVDHPVPGQATPGPAVEDTLNIDLSGLFQAVDFDGDTAQLTGSSTITITDDIPVVAATPTNLLVNGSFELGHTDIGDGQWSIYTQIPGWTSGADGVPFEVQVGNVGGILAEDGNAKVELDSDPSGGNDPNNHNPTGHTNATIEQTVSTVANDVYELTFWYSPRDKVVGTDSSSFNVLWDGHVVASIDSTHIPLGWQEFTFGVTGTGSDTLAFQGTGTEDTLGALIDNVGLVERAGIVDEGGLPGGNDNNAPTIATGSLASLVSLGADGPAAGGGFAFVPHTDGDASSFIAGLDLSSQGSMVDHATINGNTIAAFAHDGHEVFTLTVDGDGTWSFTLLSPLDDPQNGEDALTLDFSKIVQATDFDGDTVSLNPDTFAIAVIDDVPVAANVTAGMDANASATVTVTEHVDFSFGADGPGSVTFDIADAKFTADPTGGHLVLPTADQYTINGDSITLNPGADFQALANGQTATLEIPYIVTDHDGDKSVGDISLTITGVTQGPTANSDTIVENYSPGSSFLIPVAGLLANDSDPNATVNLTGASFSDATHHFISFSSPLNTDPTFSYTITDGNGTSAAATVTVERVDDSVANHTSGGDDFLIDQGSDTLDLPGTAGTDVLAAGLFSTTTYEAGPGNDLLVALVGGTYTLNGDVNGNDTFIAGFAASTNTLNANGALDNFLHTGEDTLEFLAPVGSSTNVFNGFSSGQDAVAVSKAGFNLSLGVGSDASSIFEAGSGSAFTNTNNQFHFDTNAHILYYSPTGTASNEIALAQVTNGTMTGHDIHVVA